MSEREPFRVEGVGCWCDGSTPLHTVRIMGHTEKCSQARRGWRANYAHLSASEQQKRADTEAGRQLREAAEAVLAKQPPS